MGVWLGSLVPDDTSPDAYASIKDMVSEDEEEDEFLPPAYFITFGVGHLVAQVMIPLAAVADGSRVRRRLVDGTLKQLWPDLLTPLVWPPPQTLTWAEMDDSADFQTIEPPS